ncbi:CHASE2 domain-containing protein [Malaciobacter mytili]|uniref:CHASE2 domain-containing protein n=1 Tax=Malaciobacter mytili TaxID=603050 RepID=UPI003A862749
MDYVFNAKGVILNIPIIQNSAYSSGFFNSIPDDTGVIRSVPLILRYEEQIYSSLALELLRALYQEQKVLINYDNLGVQNISFSQLSIPTDRYGRLMVNFRGDRGTFPYLSVIDILNNNFKKEELKDKIILIGTSAAGLLDLRATPYWAAYPGVEVHANVIDNIITQDFLQKPYWIEGADTLHMILLLILVFIVLISSNIYLIPFFILGFFLLDFWFLYEMLFSKGYILNIFFPLFSIAIGSTIAVLINYFFEIKQANLIKNKFSSKVSSKVMEDLLKNESKTLQSQAKEITVFFSDIRSFTTISEEMDSANSLVTYLNNYMEPMSEIIMKNEGTIDKFIGDAIMAYWNAPSEVKNHADKAVKASLEQLKYLKILNERLKENNLPLIEIGIGLNTGIAVVGEMGSKGRSDYTVIGDPINLGSRLESLCKYYDSKLNISNFTKEKLKEEYIFRFLDLVKVKGKSKPVEIWQVIDFGKANKTLQKELETYNLAIKLYKEEKFTEALKIFESLDNNENKTNKNIYKIYIQRCEYYIKTPPKKFDGVFTHNEK